MEENKTKKEKNKLSKKTKMIFTIIAIIILIGIAITCTIGLNFDLRYRDSKRMELYLEQEFNISDIKQMTDEVMPSKKVIIQKVEVYEDTVSITAEDITDEEKQSLIDKVNEKYGTTLVAESTEIERYSKTICCTFWYCNFNYSSLYGY